MKRMSMWMLCIPLLLAMSCLGLSICERKIYCDKDGEKSCEHGQHTRVIKCKNFKVIGSDDTIIVKAKSDRKWRVWVDEGDELRSEPIHSRHKTD